MAAPTYADIVSGSLSGATYVEIHSGRVYPTINTFNKTGSGDAASEFGYARYWHNVAARGMYVVSSDNPLSLGGTPANTFFSEIMAARITRAVPLFNASSAATAQGVAHWLRRRPVYQAVIHGILTNPETPIEDAGFALSAMSLPISSATSVTANAIVQQCHYRGDYEGGGGVEVVATVLLSGTVTLGDNNPFSATSHTISLVIDNDTGTGDGDSVWSGTVYPESMSVLMDYNSGRPADIEFNGPFHDAVTIG